MSFLGLDVGTHSTKLCALSTSGALLRFDGSPFLERSHRIKNRQISPLEVQANTEEMLDEALHSCILRKEAPTHLAISSLGEAVCLLQHDRASDFVLGPSNVGKRHWQLHALRLCERKLFTDDPRNYYYSVFKAPYLLSETRGRVGARLACVEDYLLSKWVAAPAICPTTALRTGCFDPETKLWQNDVCRELGIRELSFAPVKETGTLIGEVAPLAGWRWSRGHSIQVIQGAWDIYAAALAVGLSPGQLLVNFGSVLLLVYHSACPKTCNAPRKHCATFEQCDTKLGNLTIRIIYAPGLVIASLMRLARYRDDFQYVQFDNRIQLQWVRVDVDRGVFYEARGSRPLRLEEAISRVADFDTLMTSILVSCAFEVRRIVEADCPQTQEVISVGGGARIGGWAALLSSALGIPVRVPYLCQASALGAAYVARFGAEGWGSSMNVTFGPSMLPVEPLSKLRDMLDGQYDKWVSCTRSCQLT